MKTKKHNLVISSILSQLILQNRNQSYEKSLKKIISHQTKINQMHKSNHYSKQLYFQLIDKSQYGIENKLLKQNRILKNITLIIHFKLTQKSNSNINFIQSWIVSTEKHNTDLKLNFIDPNQQLIYLLQSILQALKCQFLMQFLSMGQQFRSKYILDYQIQYNPNKKSINKLYPLHYQNIWKKQAYIDQLNKMAVTCYHNTHKKLLSLITMQKQWSRGNNIKPHHKHGSQQTKPSNSGEYQLSTSVQEKGVRSRQRKTSMIEFYDQDLNITVLSSDSDNFKKSTGRIEGVYTDEELQNGVGKGEDSDDDFQLLIEESVQQEIQKNKKNEIKFMRLKEIEKDMETILFGFDQLVQAQYF